VFVRREDAFTDEPDWAGTLFVAQLDDRDVSRN